MTCSDSTIDTYPIFIKQGATFQITITWEVGGALVDITGYTARLQARTSIAVTTTFISLTDGAGLTLGGVAGTIIVDLTAAETAAITETIGVYDLELESPGGTVTRLLQGSVTINQEVTR